MIVPKQRRRCVTARAKRAPRDSRRSDEESFRDGLSPEFRLIGTQEAFFHFQAAFSRLSAEGSGYNHERSRLKDSGYGQLSGSRPSGFGARENWVSSLFRRGFFRAFGGPKKALS
jgi:hypothetical protein